MTIKIIDTNIQEYISHKKKVYNILLSIIDDDEPHNYQQLINIIKSYNLFDKKKEFTHFLTMLIRIFKNHHRTSTFFNKFNQLFLHLKDMLKQSFTNLELFHIFERNKRIILLLFENNVITIDDIILKKLKSPTNVHYFYPEVKKFLSEHQKQKIESYLFKIDSQIIDKIEEIRRIGENYSYIYKLIRDDSVEEFVSYVNRNNFSLSSTINKSIFETNSFLIKKPPTLIEYAAFFGSIQIFQYLKYNKVKLTPSLWIYAIHSNNAELIHLLEENRVKPENNCYEDCLKEAIKCHHNQIANYILSNYIGDERKNYFIENCYENIYTDCFHYQNFEFFPTDLNSKFIFYNACQYDYLPIVKFLLETKDIDINLQIIFLKCFLFHKISILFNRVFFIFPINKISFDYF